MLSWQSAPLWSRFLAWAWLCCRVLDGRDRSYAVVG